MGKKFQIIDIKLKYVHNSCQNHLIIFGRDAAGEHVQVKVHDVDYYFYVNKWEESHADELNERWNKGRSCRCRAHGGYGTDPCLYVMQRDVEDVVLDVSTVMGKSFIGYEDSLRVMYKVKVKYPFLMRKAFWMFKDLDFFEADIDAVTRFMVDRDLVGMGWCEVPEGVTDCRADQVSAYHTDANTPLRTLSFDIEVMALNIGQFPVSEKDPIIQISTVLGVYGNPDPVEQHMFVIDTCDPIENTVVHSHEYERDLLEDFFYYIRSVDVDFIAGYNSDSFDLPYVLDRAGLLGVPATFSKSQNMVRYRRSQTSSNQRGTSERVTYEMDGIVPLDVLTVVRNEKKLRSYKLDDVAEKFLGEKKNDMSYKLIPVKQKESSASRAELARYCLQDSVLVFKLLDKLKIQINCIEMARVIGIPIYEVITRGQTHKIRRKILQEVTPFDAVKEIFIPTCRRIETEEGQVTHVPFYDLLTTDIAAATAGSDKGYQGATVVAPKKGFYSDPVAVFDFGSLYPSIMQNWNLSHDTLLPGPRDDIPYEKTPNGFYFVHKDYYKGTVVTILTKLLAARRRAKKQMKEESDPFDKEVYNGKQLALKIVCNTMYGTWDPNHSFPYPARAMPPLELVCSRESPFGLGSCV